MEEVLRYLLRMLRRWPREVSQKATKLPHELWTVRRRLRSQLRPRGMLWLNKRNVAWLCTCALTLSQDNFVQKVHPRPRHRCFPQFVHHFVAFRGSIEQWLVYFWPTPPAVGAVLGDLRRHGHDFVEFSPEIW